jgi:hypothetical protein
LKRIAASAGACRRGTPLRRPLGRTLLFIIKDIVSGAADHETASLEDEELA